MHPYVQIGLIIFVTWQGKAREYDASICTNRTLSYVSHGKKERGSMMHPYVQIGLFHMCHMASSSVPHDSFICVT